MLLPTSIDLLHCIEKTLETVIVPTHTGTGERSAAASMGHLLRHVALRIEHEGGILTEEIAMLRPLLERVASYLPSRGDAQAVAEALRRTLSQPSPAGYRNVTSLTAEVSSLRQCVCDALEYLLAHSATLDEPGRQLHQELLAYMAWEVRQEARVIDPAFEGYGPRR
jgi:hypothetical protein